MSKEGDNMKEIWKPIGTSQHYEVSNMGRVRSLDGVIMRKDGKSYTCTGKILKPYKVDDYLLITLGRDYKGHFLVHRLVAEAFIANPENKPQVNHKDGNTINNCVDNLEWNTRIENMQHALRTGLWHPELRRGEKHPLHKLSEQEVRDIKKLIQTKQYTQHTIAQMYNVSDAIISEIKTNRKWSHI